MGHINVIAAIGAGFIGAAIMNVFLFLFGLLTRSNLQPILLLGTIATSETTKHGRLSSSKKAFWVGALIYYGIGIVLGLLYVLFWKFGIAGSAIISTFIFGFFAGLMSLAALNLALRYSKKPPTIRLTDYFSPILIGNIIYGINFLYFYVLLK